MAVYIEQKEEEILFTLQTKNSMYQMKKDRFGILLHTYFGKKTSVFDYSYRLDCRDHGFSGVPYELEKDRTYSLDYLPQEYSTYGGGDFRIAALKILYPEGDSSLELRYDSYTLEDGKYSLPNLPAVYAMEENTAQTLKIVLFDDRKEVKVTLYYGIMEDLNVITRAAAIENLRPEPIYLDSAMSMNVDFLDEEYDRIDFYGKHLKERQVSRRPIAHGISETGSVRGTSSHQYNPFMIMAKKDTNEEHGTCYGFSLLFSGNFSAKTEKDQFDSTRAMIGVNPETMHYQLRQNEVFYAPEVAMVHSDQGLSRMSQTFHKLIRYNICRGKYKTERRPVLINNWEGTYFSFTGEKLTAMAEQAADLGVEMFVLDDGWFGKRESDLSGLGDWVVNEEKLGCTMGELSDKIHALGMKFGLWFEPEAISEDSELYRQHPDWVLKVPGKKPSLSRYQLILDFSREDVRNEFLRMFFEVLDHAKIEYVKWDMNRSICNVYSNAVEAQRQGNIGYDYVIGVYKVLDAMLTRYPDLLIEGCSGGGGRFDAGMLYYTPQIWTSDDTDAIERLDILFGTSMGYPVSTMGAHVSAVPNHQTGRITSLETRATVAMSGTFGYELDPMKLSEEEKETIRKQIRVFKERYDLIQNGTFYRLTEYKDPCGYCVWQYVSEDRSEALVCAVQTTLFPNPNAICKKLRGLDPERIYDLDGTAIPGDVLMEGGILLPQATEEYKSWNFELKAR